MTAMHDLAGAYALDALEDGERAEFERHLAGCEECAAEVARNREAAARLALAVAVPAPERLRQAVLGAIGGVGQEAAASAPDGGQARKATTARVPKQGAGAGAPLRPPKTAGGTTRPPSRPNGERTRRVLALTCVVFGLAAAAFAWTTIRVHDRQVTAEKREQAVAAVLAAPDVKTATGSVPGGGTLTAYYSPTRGNVIAANGLPALTGGRTYELWYLDGPGRPARPVGTSRFDTPQDSMVVASAKLPTAQLGITVEPSGGSKTPTTPLLAQVPLG